MPPALEWISTMPGWYSCVIAIAATICSMIVVGIITGDSNKCPICESNHGMEVYDSEDERRSVVKRVGPPGDWSEKETWYTDSIKYQSCRYCGYKYAVFRDGETQRTSTVPGRVPSRPQLYADSSAGSKTTSSKWSCCGGCWGVIFLLIVLVCLAAVIFYWDVLVEAIPIWFGWFLATFRNLLAN